MTVFVDDMRAAFRRMIMCHMIADGEAELHAMAAAIGIARRWYQGDHYDIALAKRALALTHGALPITWRQCGLMCAVRVATGALPLPADAERDWRALRARHHDALVAADLERFADD